MRQKAEDFLKQIVTKAKVSWAYAKQHPFKSFVRISILGVAMLILLYLTTLMGLFGHIPGKKELLRHKNPITSTIYGSDEKPIGVYYLQNRSNVDSTELNPYLIQALVSTEDVRFYQHAGIDYKSYGRVLVKSILMRQGKGGGSTITQQIVKNIFGRKDYWMLSMPINKLREVIIARRLEAVYNKEELLLLYFNTVSFGENLYGIAMASDRFYSKKPAELTLSECATLVGVLKAPSYYNPRKSKERAENRRNIVLQQMVKNNAISQEEADMAKTPITLKYREPIKLSSLSGYYKEYIREAFDTWASENPGPNGEIYDIEEDGLNIYTSLQPNIQRYCENTMVRNVNRLQSLMDKHWASKTTEGGKQTLISNLIEQQVPVKQLRQRGKSEEEIQRYIQTVTQRDYWEIGKGFESRSQSLEDSIVSALIRLHTGILVVNSRNGAILGYAGGIDYGFSQIDNIRVPKQVGSTFKPITYLTALDQGVDPCDFYDNTLVTYKEYEDWSPRNADNKYGGSYSIHGALANSVNTVSVALQMKMGTPKVIKKAQKMGITSEIPEVPSIVLGTADISLMEMVTAYGSISNGGFKIEPYIIQKITDQDGNVLFNQKPKYHGRVASEESINQLQHMMREVLTEGSGDAIVHYDIPYNIIGKTGTTQNNGDGWFVGCTPEIVVGAWVGTQDKRVHFESTYLGSGANTAMPMVASIFKSLSMWKNPLISNFEFDHPYFSCPMQSGLSAAEATSYYASDSAYIKELRLLRAPMELMDSTKLDSLSIDMSPSF